MESDKIGRRRVKGNRGRGAEPGQGAPVRLPPHLGVVEILPAVAEAIEGDVDEAAGARRVAWVPFVAHPLAVEKIAVLLGRRRLRRRISFLGGIFCVRRRRRGRRGERWRCRVGGGGGDGAGGEEEGRRRLRVPEEEDEEEEEAGEGEDGGVEGREKEAEELHRGLKLQEKSRRKLGGRHRIKERAMMSVCVRAWIGFLLILYIKQVCIFALHLHIILLSFFGNNLNK